MQIMISYCSYEIVLKTIAQLQLVLPCFMVNRWVNIFFRSEYDSFTLCEL